MSKVLCTRCGVPILPETAERNGGLCMPCKLGTREAIEEGKHRLREERERYRTDPFRILWRQLVQRVYKSTEGFEGLTEPEKRYFAVQLLDGEVYNGGFDQYFFNSSGSYYRYAVLGLEEMEAAHALALLHEAKQVLFDFADVPESTSDRRKILRQPISGARKQRLEQLSELYWKDPDALWSRCEAFGRKHGLV